MYNILSLLAINKYESTLLKSLIDFYQDPVYLSTMYSIVKLQRISIRLIDHFITKHCKLEQMFINNIKIYLSYKQQLKMFQKTYFDPFSRGLRIPFIQDNYCFITTIGQLNFFKWLIENNIHTYIINNVKSIEATMKYTKPFKKKLYQQTNIRLKKITVAENSIKHSSGVPILLTF